MAWLAKYTCVGFVPLTGVILPPGSICELAYEWSSLPHAFRVTATKVYPVSDDSQSAKKFA